MILLAGGLGFIGSNVAIELLKKNYDVLIVDDLSNSDISCLKNLYSLCTKYNINHNKLEFIQFDLTNFEKVNDIFINHNIEHIVCLAGKKAVAESIQIPNEYYFTNITIHLNLSRCAEIYKIKSYIFSSSATVYGTEKPPLTENSNIGIGITNPYGWSKYMIEMMIKDIAKVSKVKYIILRYFNPVGSDESHLLGENPKNIPNNLVPIILSKIDTNGVLNIYGNDYETKDGTCIRDFIHIYDLAIGHIKAIEYSYKMIDYNLEIFNLGSGTGFSVLELINKFIDVNHIDLKYSFTERRNGDIPECWADISKSKNMLHYEPIKTLNDICIDAYQYYLTKSKN